MRTVKIELPTIEDLVNGLVLKGVYDIAKWLIERLRKSMQKQSNSEEFQKPVFDMEKYLILRNIDLLHQIPVFDIENATMNSKLLNLHYAVTIEYLLRFELDNGELRYISGNHSISVNSKFDLIMKLEAEKKNPTRNDSRYYLGFRTLSYLLREHLEEISKNELKELTNRLEPFFSTYSRKQYLNHYTNVA